MTSPSDPSELNDLKQKIDDLRQLLAGEPVALEAALHPLLEKQAVLEAELSGSGVVTQGSVQAAGERGVVGAAARENIITGDNNTVNRIINLYLNDEGQEPQEREEATLRQQMFSYLKWVYEEYGAIELRGVKREGQQVVQLDLETIYVPLAAQTYHRVRPRKIALDQVLTLGERMAVTGGPGSGKTTVLLHLARTLSEALLRDDPVLAETKLGLRRDLPLPLFVPLSAYAFTCAISSRMPRRKTRPWPLSSLATRLRSRPALSASGSTRTTGTASTGFRWWSPPLPLRSESLAPALWGAANEREGTYNWEKIGGSRWRLRCREESTECFPRQGVAAF